MTIKLIRTDAIDCTKIPLQHGEHIIGRGKLLDCNDKRISREHGELLVKDDSITIKALHQNPCFYIKKGSKDTEILRLGNSIALNNGDRFGLLPDSYWYEVLYCLEENSEDNETDKYTEEYPVEELNVENNDLHSGKTNDESRILNYDETLNQDGPESPSLISNHEETNRPQNDPVLLPSEDNEPIVPQPENERVIPQPQNEPIVTQAENERVIPQPQNEPIVTQAENEPNITQTNNEPASQSELKQPKCEPEDGSSNTSPSIKRSHSPEGDVVKKIKTEDDKVKQEPDVKPGTSDQAAAANANNGPSNNKPNVPRERCMYGAKCYRKNPTHRAQYSHPCDNDWGPGERGICPYGVNCGKRDPRHWRDHEHPPGVLPPVAPGQKKKRRRDSDVLPGDIVTGKRNRKVIQRPDWNDSGSEQESDPFGTDESDEWEPDSRDYSEDYV